jgi:hypothetical protein
LAHTLLEEDMTSGKDLVSELIQAVVALSVLVPTAIIAIHQAWTGAAFAVPDVLAVADGAVIAFYFRSVIVSRATNGAALAAAIAAAGAAAGTMAATKPQVGNGGPKA